MLFIKNPLNKTEEDTLVAMRDNHSLSMTRKRAHSILLSNQGYSVPYITEILGVCRQSISSWIKAWDSIGFIGLLEQHFRQMFFFKKHLPEIEVDVLVNYLRMNKIK
jgi:hypothetical protein